MYAKDNKQSCLIQKTSNGKIEYNTKYGKNCTMLRPVTLTDVNVVTLDKGLELNGACVLNGSDLAYYVNIEKINNKLILNNDSYNVKCKNGYNTTDGKGFVYKCSNGNLTFDNENSSIDSDCVLIKCEKTSPVYDKNNNRVADHLYGITFASRVDDYRPFTVCYTDSLSNDVSIITGNLEVEPGKFASCSNDRVKGTNYYNFIGRTVDCVSGNSSTNFKPYWVMRSVSSCPLDTLVKTYSGLEIKFGYEGVIKPVEEIMTSGAKQIRVFKHRDDYDKVNANLKSVEGNSITGSVLVTCNNDDSWKVESNGTIDYVYTGNVQTFTPKYYGAEGKKLTLEVWGGSGSCDRGGLGGYSKGIEKGSSLKDKLYIVVGGSGDGANGGYNGGGNGSSNWPCGGGGATHIATSTGVLALLESKKNTILIVGGGGGGSNSRSASAVGGAGGGANLDGGNGGSSIGGSLSSGGTSSNTQCFDGSFGQGADGKNCNDNGGGSGYYGGGTGLGSAGGSGYCDINIFTCTGLSGKNSGNGKASISW